MQRSLPGKASGWTGGALGLNIGWGDCASYNALAAFERQQSIYMNAMRTIRESMTILSELEPQIATLEKWHGHLVDWRAALIARLHTTPANSPQVYGLGLSLVRIDRGLDLVNEAYPANLPLDDLMRAEGYVPVSLVSRAHGDQWHGSLPVVARKLRELRARRDDAQERLDAVLAARDAKHDMHVRP